MQANLGLSERLLVPGGSGDTLGERGQATGPVRCTFECNAQKAMRTTSVSAVGILTAFGYTRTLLHMLSQADRRSSYSFHTIDTTSPIFFQDPTGL